MNRFRLKLLCLLMDFHDYLGKKIDRYYRILTGRYSGKRCNCSWDIDNEKNKPPEIDS